MRKLYCFVLLFLVVFTKLRSATCTASTGLYSSTTTWSCGHVPTNGDVVWIPSGVTVTVDITTALLSNTNFYVSGTLSFNNACKIKLDCNSSITLWLGGKLTDGNGGSKVEYCGNPNAWQGPTALNGPTSIGTTPTPIELIAFRAYFHEAEQKVELNWSTATETNNDYYTIESGTDGINFRSLDYVDGADNSTSQIDYTYFDAKYDRKYEGPMYYRLKQTDFNGDFTYSPVEMVNITNKPYVFFPNPSADGNFTLQIDNAEIALFNHCGQELFNRKVSFKTSFHLDETGFYLLRINTGEKVYNVGVINSNR